MDNHELMHLETDPMGEQISRSVDALEAVQEIDRLTAHLRPDPVSETGRPMLTLAQAAKACSTSQRTVSRRLKEGKILGASRTREGQWAIPIEGLIAAGLEPYQSKPEPAATIADELRETKTRLETALVELAETKAKAEGLERLAEAVQDNISDLRSSLKMIEAAKVETSEISDREIESRIELGILKALEAQRLEAVIVPPVVEEPKRKRWGRR